MVLRIFKMNFRILETFKLKKFDRVNYNFNNFNIFLNLYKF